MNKYTAHMKPARPKATPRKRYYTIVSPGKDPPPCDICGARMIRLSSLDQVAEHKQTWGCLDCGRMVCRRVKEES